MKFKNIKSLIPCSALLVGSVLFAALSINNLTESNAATISVTGDNGVRVYVSGDGVTYNNTTKNYEVPTGTEVTISVVNEARMFTSIKVGSADATSSSVVTTTVTGDLQITLDTTYATADHQGKCFGKAWVLDEQSDIEQLANILNNDFSSFEPFTGAESIEDIQYGYYIVNNSIFLDVKDFNGIGTTTYPFHGCIDFLGNYISINASNSGGLDTYNGGFFGVVRNGSGRTLNLGKDLNDNDIKTTQKECVLRNVNLKGNISYVDNTNSSSIEELSVGGVAGSISGNVVLDGIDSSVSVNVNVQSPTVYAATVFGQLSQNIDSWSNVKASGAYTSVEAITRGNQKSAYTGSLTGRLNSSSVYSFTNNITNGVYIANSLNEHSGHSIAAATIGYVAANSAITLKNVVFDNHEDMELSSIIENTTGNGDEKAIGTFGYGYIDGSSTVNIYPIDMIQENGKNYDIQIRTSTQSANSKGNAYVGGFLGYLANTNVYLKDFDDISFFKTNVYLSAEVTGTGGAYAGGLFAYQPPLVDNSITKDIALNENDTRVEVYATQLAACTTENIDTSAGYYAPVLDINSEEQYLKNLNFTVYNSILTSQRDVGSTAYGNIYAGGLIGSVFCRVEYGTYYADQLVGINLTLDNTSVSALGLSFESPANGQWVNNVSVGGMFGFVEDCGILNDFDRTYVTGETGGVVGATNLNIVIKVGTNNEKYAVKGIQNAKEGSTDHENEGHVGGLIGMLRRGNISNVSTIGHQDSITRPIITFNSTNSPNTAAVGGLMGENAKGGNCKLANVTVDNVHVIGRAYSYTNTDDKYDVYAGGVAGVLAKEEADRNSIITDAKVTNSKIECIGEESMLTYAGGLTGGAWWQGFTGLYNIEVVNNEILASSVSSKAYAGGLSGLIQSNSSDYDRTYVFIDNCYIINNYISAISAESEAYAAGISSRKRAITSIVDGENKISNVYINSTITGSAYVNSSGTEDIELYYDAFATICSNDDYNYGFNNVFVNPENLNIASGTAMDAIPDKRKESKDWANDANVKPLYIAPGNNIGYSVDISNGSTISIFSATTWPANAVVRYSGNTEYLLDSNGDIIVSGVDYTNGTIKANSTDEGTVYASLCIKYKDTYYELVNQPIIINGGDFDQPSEIKLMNSETDVVINATNKEVAGYNEGSVTIGTTTTNYYYAAVNVGQTTIDTNGNATQSIQISYSDYKNYNLYTTTATLAEAGQKTNEYLYPADYSYDTRVKSILEKKDSKLDFYFFEFLEFGYEGSSVILTPRSDITERVYIIYEFGSGTSFKTVIIEFIPNALDSVEIEPASYTPQLGISADGAYIFAPGDTINFEVKENHRFFYESSSKGYLYEPIRNASGYIAGKKNNQDINLYYSDVSVNSNGTTVIYNTDNIKGASFVVKATSSIDSSRYDEITIYIDEEIDFRYTTSGAYFDSNRKVVFNTPFDFKVTPTAGYGLAPTTLSVTLEKTSGNVTYNLHDGNLKFHTTQDQSGTIKAGDTAYSFSYNYSAVDGSYSVTIPGGLLDTNVDEIVINVVFGSIYNIVFDIGYEPTDGSDRYFVYQITHGANFKNTDILEQVNDHLKPEVYGHDFQGYYLIQDGSNLSDYAVSFEDYCTDGKIVTGPMQFYARYTYEVIALLPEIFEINTELYSHEVMPIENDAVKDQLIKIIPVDSNDGFEFTLTHDGSWYGDIPFEVYIITEESGIDISSTKVTDAMLNQPGVNKVTQYVEQVAKNSYYLPDEYINGYIVVRGYAEELTFSAGESETDTYMHDIYGDSTFTAMYAITYNKGTPVDITKTVSYSNIENIDGNEVIKGAGFKFIYNGGEFNLPVGTSIRLYRFINHTLYDAGVLVLDSEKSTLYAHDFANMDTGEPLTLPNVASVHDQKYNLVVTLPNHEGFNATYKNIKIDLISTFTEKYNYYDYANSAFYQLSNDGYISHAEDEFNIHPTVPYQVSYSNYNVKFTIGSKVTDVPDLRHDNKYYVWRIEKTANEAIPNNVTLGTLSPIVKTNNAYYYLATSGLQINVSDLKGYTITLLEVDNVQDPASGVVVWTQAIS